MAVTRLWLGNIPFRVSDQELAEFVAPVGKATRFKVPVHRDTGIVIGYAFVDVRLEDGLAPADAAEALDQNTIQDRHDKSARMPIDVQVAHSRPDFPVEEDDGEQGDP